MRSFPRHSPHIFVSFLKTHQLTLLWSAVVEQRRGGKHGEGPAEQISHPEPQHLNSELTCVISNCVRLRSISQITHPCCYHCRHPVSLWLCWDDWTRMGITARWPWEGALLCAGLTVLCQIATVLLWAPETQILSICSHIFQSWTKVHWDQWNFHTGDHEFCIQLPQMKVQGTGRKSSTRKSVSIIPFYDRCFGNDYVLYKEIWLNLFRLILSEPKALFILFRLFKES